MRAAARGTKFPWKISVRGGAVFLGAGRFAAFRRVFLWKTWPGGIGGTVKFFFASAYFCAIFRLWVVRRGDFDYN